MLRISVFLVRILYFSLKFSQFLITSVYGFAQFKVDTAPLTNCIAVHCVPTGSAFGGRKRRVWCTLNGPSSS
jgi:hypothetical protein